MICTQSTEGVIPRVKLDVARRIMRLTVCPANDALRHIFQGGPATAFFGRQSWIGS